jgi:hypothetical protein
LTPGILATESRYAETAKGSRSATPYRKAAESFASIEWNDEVIEASIDARVSPVRR